MKFQVSEGEKFQKIMEVEIAAEEMEQPLRLACKRLAEKVNIPGFRKGKAPRTILENYLGIQAILEEAADIIMPQAYMQGLKENSLRPVCPPDIEIGSLESKKPFVFKAAITVEPEIKLGQYKELPVTRRILDISDQDVEEEIEKQRRRMTKLVDAEPDATAELGDTVNIDFRGLKDDIPFEGGTAEDYPLELGSHSFIPGFEEQLVGAKTDEEKRIKVAFPEGYPAEELAGQPVVFEIKVRSIKRKQLPELNQEFVEEVSETAENIDQLKAEIRNRLLEETMRMAVDSAHKNAILSAVDACEVELPPVMVEQEIDQMLEENKQQLAGRGLTMDKYLEYMGLSEEQLREEMRPQAEFDIKRGLMLDAIIAAEQIEVSEDELNEKISETAQHYYVTEQQIRDSLGGGERLEDFKHEIKRMKAMDLIYDHAVITDEHIDREALAAKMAEQAAEQAAAEKAQEDTEATAEAAVEAESKVEE